MNSKQQAFTEEATEWSNDKSYTPSQPQSLPHSKDNDFWGQDAIKHQVDVKQLTDQTMEQMQRLNTHSLRVEGNDFVCSSCPFTHTIPLSTKHFTLDKLGKLIPIDKSSA